MSSPRETPSALSANESGDDPCFIPPWQIEVLENLLSQVAGGQWDCADLTAKNRGYLRVTNDSGEWIADIFPFGRESVGLHRARIHGEFLSMLRNLAPNLIACARAHLERSEGEGTSKPSIPR